MSNVYKYRTAKGIVLEKKHDATYKKWLLGKEIILNWGREGGFVADVQYIGNSVYGLVKILFLDGREVLYCPPDVFKPRKSDFTFV